MISYEDYITASGKYPERLTDPELTQELKDNAILLLSKVNAYLIDIGVTKVVITSGFRPSGVNSQTKGAGTKSNHMKCLAIDIADVDSKLMNLFLQNLDKAQKHGIWTEDFRHTKTWIHLQCVPPKSKKRIFLPSINPPPAPDKWDGVYDTKYDKENN